MVFIHETRGDLSVSELLAQLRHLVLERIGQAFEEDRWKDVVLELLGIQRPTDLTRRFPQPRLQARNVKGVIIPDHGGSQIPLHAATAPDRAPIVAQLETGSNAKTAAGTTLSQCHCSNHMTASVRPASSHGRGRPVIARIAAPLTSHNPSRMCGSEALLPELVDVDGELP